MTSEIDGRCVMRQSVLTSFAQFGHLTPLEQKYAPQQLWMVGDQSFLSAGPRVSIIGSRTASSDGLRRAASLARELVARDAIVVSGLAEGVDTVAHRETMSWGGRTIAVIGTGIDRTYPASNRALQERIAREHLLVAQFPPGTPPRRQNFPQRNRTMALLSDATIVVAATENSGTKHQAFEALRLGRLLLIPEPLVSRLAWPKEAVKYGAQILRQENVAHIVKQIPHLTVDVEIPA